MHILLLAPHPFYQERGTPIAVDLLLRVLSDAGHKIDVLTYHEGDNRDYGGNVKIFRIPPPRSAQNVKPGFTLKKLICDFYMRPMAIDMCQSNNYDIVHAVEESVFMAMTIKKRFSIPYIMDMDSSMPEQIAEKLPVMRPVLPIMRAFEKNAARSAAAVIAVCGDLAHIAKNYGAQNVTVLNDISLLPPDPPPLVPDLKTELNISGICFMYVGNLEKYQGIDLLLESFSILQRQTEGADLVLIGGAENDIETYRNTARDLGVLEHTHFLGPKPVSMLGSFLNEADVLVSPRVKGGNTPMKIYSYLDAGKAILATDLTTHTQVLDNKTAILEEPRPEPFAQGMIRILQDPGRRLELGRNAKHLASEKYSMDIYCKTLIDLYSKISDKQASKPGRDQT